MTIEELKIQLQSQFNLVAMYDLGEMSVSPGALIKKLQAVYQEEYQPTDRIVFYTSYQITEAFLEHLYKMFNFLNISNWFVLICSKENAEQSIKTACAKFSHDPIPFQFWKVDLDPTHKIVNDFILPKTICAIPWRNLEIKSDGDIYPCCMATNISLGNIKDTTLEQAFNSDPMLQLRKSLLAGEKPSTCNNCWKVEEKGLTSIRMHNIGRLQKDFLLKYLDQPSLTSIDIKFNNTCNFKCRICGPGNSSLFAIEEHKFRGKPLMIQDNWGESQQFIDQINSHLPDITNIDMFGGEPFLIKNFNNVLKLAVEKNYAKKIQLHYNSNGSIWPGHLVPYWPNFKLVDIHFSIDAIGKQFELQRGGSWSEVESNILRLKQLDLPNLNISIMPTISIMSVYYIDQVYDWATKHGFQIFVSHVRRKGMELQYLTKQAKQLIIDKFQNHPWSEIQNIIKTIQELPDTDGREFCEKIKWFDQIRKENFAESHPEIAKAMGYV